MSDLTYLQPDNKDLWKIFGMNQYFTSTEFQVLDFGCNRSNFVGQAYRNTRDQNLNFKPTNYTGVDLNLASLEVGRRNYPRCAPNIIHYNKYHPSFNPTGIKDLKVSQVLNKKFDVIIAYSVFTHCSVNETREVLLDLEKLLVPRGSILFTMWLSDSLDGFYNYTMASKNLEKTPERYYNLVQKDFNKCLYWIDLETSVADVEDFDIEQADSLGIFYKDVRSVLNILPRIEYLGKPNFTNQYQHLFRYGHL